MTRYLPLCAALCTLALAGCTDADWDHTMSFAGFPDQRADASPPPPAPAAHPVAMAAPPDTGFCEAVAKQDATSDGFDAATQNRVFQRSFQQCVSLFAGGNDAQRTANSR